jgi:hypothetical protein
MAPLCLFAMGKHFGCANKTRLRGFYGWHISRQLVVQQLFREVTMSTHLADRPNRRSPYQAATLASRSQQWLTAPTRSGRRPLIYWRVVAVAGAANLLLIAGFVGVLAAVGRPAGHAKRSPIPALPVAPVAVSAQRIAHPPPAPLVVEPPLVGLLQETSVPSEPAIARPSSTRAPVSTPLPPKPAAIDPVADEALLGSAPAEETCGFDTRVAFLSDPVKAAQRANKEHKLFFLLHLSGNFEEAGFT